MAPLKSLEKEYPILDSNFQSFCATHAIFTVEDFLLHDLYVLAALSEQQPNREILKEGITQVLSILDGMHQPWLHGLDLLEDAQLNKHVLSTGFEGLDLFLQGGLRGGQLAELVGPSSSGKTQVCLRIASTVVKKHMGIVVYIDTGNSFSPQRIEHFIQQTSNQGKKDIVQTMMSNILCHSVFDIFAMFDLLYELNLRSQNGDCKIVLLIIDSFSSLITPILGGNGSQGHGLMTSAGILLKKLAHDHNIVVLVTNHMVSGEGGDAKPALGESWRSIPHVRYLLIRDRRSNTCNISVLKHTSKATGEAATFSIDN